MTYYQDDTVTLHLGDWRELIPEDFTADLILTDPPYGETSLDWDRWPQGWPALAARHSRSMCSGLPFTGGMLSCHEVPARLTTARARSRAQCGRSGQTTALGS